MHLAIFGLAISSSYGNGHAALWRALIGALLDDGHAVTFFERDVAWYAAHRDLTTLPTDGRLVLYRDWDAARAEARAVIGQADVVIATSYCADGPAALAMAAEASSRPFRCFYDLDTPVTLARVAAGERPDYLPVEGLAGCDLVLSYTGGPALEALRGLGARRVAALYGSVDPAAYAPAMAGDRRAALSYLGTYAADRQAALERLLVSPARALPAADFVIGGAQYPDAFPWTSNIRFIHHVPPAAHPGFYAGSRLTLNVTRAAMARMGWCPSGRLFEAASCGAAIISDWWPGLDEFFVPGEEILIARHTSDVLRAIDLPDSVLSRVGAAARARALRDHSAARRAGELIGLLGGAAAMAAE